MLHGKPISDFPHWKKDDLGPFNFAIDTIGLMRGDKIPMIDNPDGFHIKQMEMDFAKMLAETKIKPSDPVIIIDSVPTSLNFNE